MGINSNIQSLTWELADVELDEELTLEVVGINPASTSADISHISHAHNWNHLKNTEDKVQTNKNIYL